MKVESVTMVRIAELIHDDGSQVELECDLVVSGETSVREALAQMAAHGCEHIGVATETENEPAVLSKEQVLHALLCELDEAQGKLGVLQTQIQGNIAEQLDLMQENVRSLAEFEKTKLEVAFENMTEGLIILGKKGEVEKANPSAKKLLGLGGSDLLESLAAAVDEIGFRELVTSGNGSKGCNPGEFKVKVANDKILQMRWTEMVDDWGHFLGNVVMIRDVTDEMAAEKAKTEFIASVSHELRTPLTSLQNSVSNILAGVTGKVGKKTRQYLHAMKSDCHRFANLVNDLLDMAKLEAGSMPINRRVINIVTTVAGVMHDASDDAKMKNIEVVCEVDGHISPVYADSQRIRQVLWNLLANAIRFTPDGGKITIRSFDNGDDVVTMVEDTGVGISRELQKQVFSKFYQISRQAGPGSKGSGLGLAICNGIIAVHGGAIWVESQKDRGSKFYFSLPKSDPFIVLYKHLVALADRTDRGGEGFALVIVNFDVPHEKREKLRGLVGSIVNQMLTESDHFLTSGDDLAIQTEDFEVVFVIRGGQKQNMETVQEKIKKIVSSQLRKNSAEAPILPMLSTGVYPSDSCEVRNLEKVARHNMRTMF